MELFLYFGVVVGLAATWVATRKWIRKAPEVGLLGRDMNKPPDKLKILDKVGSNRRD